MKLIVGLGNPGAEYVNTRHNAGFMAIDRIARRLGPIETKQKFHARVIEAHTAETRIMLMQPMTFMNRSGLSVGEAARFYKLDPCDVMILVDDFALPLGRIRLRASGGAGGHNGLADVQRALGTDAYRRLRLGVGAPQVDGQPIAHVDHVLGRLTDEQAAALDPGLETAADAVACWLEHGIDIAMTRFNRRSDESGNDGAATESGP